MHKRRAILEALRTQLQTLTSVGGVFIQRAAPKGRWPCLTVVALEESVDTLTIHSPARPQDRTMKVAVSGWIRGTPDDEKAESDMDVVANAIETAMTCPTAAGAEDIVLLSTNFEVSEEEPEIHVVTLTFGLTYQTVEFNPT
jgi:hypothetical protein